MATKTMKYNPAFLDEDTLIRAFVGRAVELELILETVRENRSDSNQHVLVIGPRGIGKTMLVLRAAAEIRSDPDLRARWFPLVYGEESYTVASPGEFWLEALFHLDEQTGNAQWRKAYEELRTEQDDLRLRERALAQLMDFADEQRKRILLVVENLNMLIGGQMKEEDAWALRHALMNEPRLMLLGTTTSRFRWGTLRQGDKRLPEEYDQALYELFNVIELAPLDDEEAGALWQSITGTAPPPGRMRPFQILTGGNPRLIRIISEFAADTSFQELMTNLTQLVDEHTEYFKSHLDVLPPQERKVFVALADLWDPSSARNVADAVRLDVNKTSALLNRLIERGAVTVSHERGRTKYYQVAERMYNIYHLMRRRGKASGRVRAVVRFMIYLYRGEELVQTTRSLAEEAGTLTPEQRQEHFIAYETILEMTPERALKFRIMEETAPFLKEMPDLPPSLRQRLDSLQDEKQPEKKTLLETLESIERTLDADPDDADAWRNKGIALRRLGHHEEALEAFERSLDLDPNNADALIGKGLTLWNLSRYEEAINAYDKVLDLDPNNADALIGKGLTLWILNRHEEALEAFERSLNIDPNNAGVWHNKGRMLDNLNRHEEALKAYNKALDIDPNYADALIDKGRVFLILHDFTEALEHAAHLLNAPEAISARLDRVIDFFVDIAARGHASRALNIIQASPGAELLETMAVALQLYQGEQVNVALEIREVAGDVVKKIEARRAALQKS